MKIPRSEPLITMPIGFGAVDDAAQRGFNIASRGAQAASSQLAGASQQLFAEANRLEAAERAEQQKSHDILVHAELRQEFSLFADGSLEAFKADENNTVPGAWESVSGNLAGEIADVTSRAKDMGMSQVEAAKLEQVLTEQATRTSLAARKIQAANTSLRVTQSAANEVNTIASEAIADAPGMGVERIQADLGDIKTLYEVMRDTGMSHEDAEKGVVESSNGYLKSVLTSMAAAGKGTEAIEILNGEMFDSLLSGDDEVAVRSKIRTAMNAAEEEAEGAEAERQATNTDSLLVRVLKGERVDATEIAARLEAGEINAKAIKAVSTAELFTRNNQPKFSAVEMTEFAQAIADDPAKGFDNALATGVETGKGTMDQIQSLLSLKTTMSSDKAKYFRASWNELKGVLSPKTPSGTLTMPMVNTAIGADKRSAALKVRNEAFLAWQLKAGKLTSEVDVMNARVEFMESPEWQAWVERILDISDPKKGGDGETEAERAKRAENNGAGDVVKNALGINNDD